MTLDGWSANIWMSDRMTTLLKRWRGVALVRVQSDILAEN